MNKKFNLEVLAVVWANFTDETKLPKSFQETVSIDAYLANEEIQKQLREYIATNKDQRLSSLLQMLELASLQMEQLLCPEEYEHIKHQVEEGLSNRNDFNTKYSDQEATRIVRERFHQRVNKSC